MKSFRTLVLFGSLFSAGCIGTTAISVEDLPWTIPLSTTGCPRLDSKYLDEGSLHLNFWVGLAGHQSDRSGDDFPASVERFRSPSRSGMPMEEMSRLEREFAKTAILNIYSTQNTIVATLEDQAGLIYERITLKTLSPKRVGCSNGALILRRKTVYGKGEGRSSTISFGEDEIRKLADGSLEIVKREWNAPTSALFGVGSAEPRRHARIIWPPAK